MDFAYAVCFWLLFLGLPALLVGRQHRSWARGFLTALSVSVLPFVCAVGLALAGDPLGFRTPERAEAWDYLAIGIGGTAGYLFGILLPLACFRRWDRRRASRPGEAPLLDTEHERAAAGI